jgi:hypothetical protein
MGTMSAITSILTWHQPPVMPATAGIYLAAWTQKEGVLLVKYYRVLQQWGIAEGKAEDLRDDPATWCELPREYPRAVQE